MKICVIIPAYNEAKRIGKLISAIKSYIPDVLVIDDGSSDKTEEASRLSGAIVLRLGKNQGKGQALKCGFDYALKKDYAAVLTMDGDGQHYPGDIPNIIATADSSNTGVIVGNRMANPENMPLLRFITNRFMSLIISAICRQNIPDTQCGFRLIKCTVLKTVHLVSANYEIESEILIRAGKAGFKIKSAPIKSVYEGQVSLINPILDTWRFFMMLFKTAI